VRAGEVRFKTEVSGYKEELQLYVLSQQMKSDEEFDTERFNRIPYRAGVSVDVNGTIKEIMPDMKNEYAKIFEIREGKIVYAGDDSQQVQWCRDLDIEVTDIIVDENDVLVGIRDFVYINGVVTIPNYVTSIQLGAFNNNKGIESVVFKEPSQITVIPENAFRSCSNLKSVKFPSGLVEIDGSAFRDCVNLDNVELPNTVTTIYSYAFYGCSTLTTITWPQNPSFTTLYTSVFAGTGFTNITIPNTVTTMQSGCFGSVKITTVTIPASVTSITSPFSNCANLTDMVVDGGNSSYASYDGALYTKNYSNLVSCPGGKTSFTFHPNATGILNDSFYGCNKLTGVNISAGITTITQSGFYYCALLTNLTVEPSNTKYMSLNNNALYEKNSEGNPIRLLEILRSVTSLTVSSTVANINSLAIASNPNIISVDLSNSIIQTIPRTSN